MKPIEVRFSLNQKDVSLSTLPGRTLLEVLREDFGLTGVKNACGGEGECGACTVLLDGAAVDSCLVLISQVQGHSILTIEGLTPAGSLHPIQKAFVEAGAIQCGFCTPGMVLSAKALLDKIPHPDDEQIRTALSGNLCRCTGYTKIIAAVQLASREDTLGK